MATAQLSTAHPAPVRTRRDLSALLGYLLISPPVLIMTLLIFFPILQSVLRTLFIENASTGTAAFSFENYAKFFSNRVLTNNLWFTVTETVWTVAALFVIGFPLSLYLRFSKSRIAAAVQILALFPLFVPGIILAYALIQFLGSHGSLDTMLRNIGFTDYATPYLKWNGIVIALVWEHIPFTVLVLTAGFRQVENAVIESARDVGANGWQIFTRILLPLVQRSALIVFCLNVIGVFGAFTLPYLLGPAQPMMMGVSMQQTFNGYNDVQGAETQAVITFLICAVVGLLYVHTITRPRVEHT
ncbi:MAG: ABC transporter permease subunit [Chloroflexi bacterium]|nr:ABC transporter permease subunit [Chloroflexota bacterium]